MSPWAYFAGIVVTFQTWMTPAVGHTEGWLVVYGSQAVVEANAEYRGYDLTPYRNRCGIASMSPANLGQVAWLRPPDGEWYGPCLVVDVASRVDFYELVYEKGEVAEIPRWLAKRWGTKYGLKGEVFFGLCPPGPQSQPSPYQPDLAVDAHRPVVLYVMWPYPEQQLPRQHCRHPAVLDRRPLPAAMPSTRPLFR